MKYVSLAGNWLVEAVLRLKPPKESKSRFLNRCKKRLESQARIDGSLMHRMLTDGVSIAVPLFAVGVLAKELRCSVERLLFGREDADFDDPNLFTPEDRVDMMSANNFATMLEAFHVDFPELLWDYAFPSHRRGQASEITLDQWVELHRERFGVDPAPQSHSA